MVKNLMSPQIDRTTLSQIISERRQSLELDLDGFSPAEWDRLVQMAQAEGVGPLLYWRLSRAGTISSLAKQTQHKLRAMYFGTKINNEEIVQELVTLTRHFAGAGIPVVALKGICFALTIYPDLGLRPMADVDLLVPASKLAAAVRIAEVLGYVKALPEAFPGVDEIFAHAVCLKKSRMPFTTLELHTTLVAEEAFTHAVPVDWFWSQTERIDPIGSTISFSHLYMLTPTAQVLYACAHAMLQHGGRETSLRWLYDLDRLICIYARQERLDWDLFLSQARRFAWASSACAAFSETVRLFDTPIPPHVLEELSRQPDRNAERVATLQAQPATHILEEYQKWKSLNGVGRLKLILALAVPSPAYMRWRYGLRTSRVLPAYYLYRWWGILKDAIRTAIVLMQGGHSGGQVDK